MPTKYLQFGNLYSLVINYITRQNYNIILVIVDKLTKQGYFIVYIEEILAENIAKIYIKEVFIKYKALNKIILDRDLKFIIAF